MDAPITGPEIAVGLALPPLLQRAKLMDGALAAEIRTRTRSWVVLGLLIGGAALLGAAWWMLGLCLLACFAYVEFAFCCGKALGRRKLCPGTSPGKTLAGAIGACAARRGW